MREELVLLNILLSIFAILVSVISAILARKTIKAEKIARPFLLSLFVYFLLLAIANFQQVSHNIINFEQIVASGGPLNIYTTFFVFLLTLAAPIYLIFQIEKNFFLSSTVIKKFHIFTMIICVLFAGFLINVIILALNDFTVITDFQLSEFLFTVMPLLGLEIFFILFAFLYFGLKAAGKYRLYCLMVSLGWLLNYAVNTIATLAELSAPVIVILFIPKLIGVILTAIGLYRLYSLKSD